MRPNELLGSYLLTVHAKPKKLLPTHQKNTKRTKKGKERNYHLFRNTLAETQSLIIKMPAT